MHDFSLFIDSGGQTGSSAAELSFARILGSASSRNRSTTACILGVTGTDAEADAARLAEDYVNHRQDSNLARRQPAGVVFLDHSAGTVEVLAAPVGLVQVFWTSANGRLSIASDPRMLEEPGPHIRPLRLESLYQYVYFHMLPSPAAIYEGVEKLDGGHLLHWNGGEAKRSRYWRASFGNESSGTEPERRRELLETLQAAVNRSMGSNGRVGAFLSGGLDSSTVAGMAARVQPGIPTISMGFDAAGYDEMEYARIASSHFKTSPLEYYVTPDDVLRTLPAIITAFTEPFGNSSAAAAYHCARIAREHGIDLLLAGDGGDELFGGYSQYLARDSIEQFVNSVPRVLRRPLGAALGAAPGALLTPLLARGNTWAPNLRARLVRELQNPSTARSYESLLARWVEPADILSAAQIRRAVCDESLRWPHARTDVEARMTFDMEHYLPDDILVKVDRSAMACSLETRAPLLDHRVVEFALRQPLHRKIRDGRGKFLLRNLLVRYVPPALIDRPKRGFSIPLGAWLRGALKSWGDTMLESDALLETWFQPSAVNAVWSAHQRGEDHAERLWPVLIAMQWLRSTTTSSS